MELKRVVITGLGAVTPIGNDVETYWNGLKEGRCGIAEIKSFPLTEDFEVTLAAEVKDFDPTQRLDRKQAKRLAPFSQYALYAAKEAMEQSGLDMTKEDPYRIGTIIGVGIGDMNSFQEEGRKLAVKGPKRIAPMFIPTAIPNMAAGNIAIEFGMKGPNFDVTTACASATHAMGEAYQTIQMGKADAIVTGGAEGAMVELSVAGFTKLTALNSGKDPNRASIPFDKERSGFVMGEGSGILILEELEHAKARGAKILGEVVGYGATCDAYHMTAPEESGEAMAQAIRIAIGEAGIDPSEVSYINAHGTSTHYNDLIETRAYKLVFGEDAYRIPISSIKSMIGHGLGAAGGQEAVCCVKVLMEGFIPPTINYQVPDPECDLDYVPNVGRSQELTYVLSDNLGFGGHNGAILFKKYEA